MLNRRRLFVIFFIVICFLGYKVGIYFLNDRFLVTHLINNNLEEPIVSFTDKEALSILEKPFYYLGQGSQMYAFESEDGKYVLKLIKQQRLRTLTLPEAFLPSFLKDIQAEKQREKKEKRSKLYGSCKIAWNELRNECGLVAMELGGRSGALSDATFYDKLGRKYSVPLKNTEFILQKKGELITPTLKKLISAQKIEEAKKRIDALHSLLLIRCQKGIFDSDASIAKNAGFLEERAIYIDIGSFSKKSALTNPHIYTKEIEKIMHRLNAWLLTQNEELALYSQTQVTIG